MSGDFKCPSSSSRKRKEREESSDEDREIDKDLKKDEDFACFTKEGMAVMKRGGTYDEFYEVNRQWHRFKAEREELMKNGGTLKEMCKLRALYAPLNQKVEEGA